MQWWECWPCSALPTCQYHSKWSCICTEHYVTLWYACGVKKVAGVSSTQERSKAVSTFTPLSYIRIYILRQTGLKAKTLNKVKDKSNSFIPFSLAYLTSLSFCLLLFNFVIWGCFLFYQFFLLLWIPYLHFFLLLFFLIFFSLFFTPFKLVVSPRSLTPTNKERKKERKEKKERKKDLSF